jgi:hypothetical protein
MFVTAAFKHVDAELDDDDNTRDCPPVNIPMAVQQLWSGTAAQRRVQRDQQKQQQQQQRVPLPPPQNMSH